MILDDIIAKNIIRVNLEKERLGFDKVKKEAERFAACTDNKISFYDSLKKEGMSFICEVKKASPSKGIIAETFPYLEIAKEYEHGGAAAVSVLTEPYFFLGNAKYLYEISQNIKIPVLRKDFIFDSFQIYQAKCLGASAVLLICSVLDKNRLSDFMKISEDINLDCLVEVYDEKEAETALKCSAAIIGVNNRNLKDFTVDINNTARLRKYIPDEDIVFVSESGIKTAEDMIMLKENNVNAVLIGETLMRQQNKKDFLISMKEAVNGKN